LPVILLFQNISVIEQEKLKNIFKQETRSDDDLNFTLELIKKYNIIKECYKKAEHFINLASNSLTVFKDSDEKKILENLTSFSLERSF
jgi:octaprenyl-diphosphate synthase